MRKLLIIFLVLIFTAGNAWAQDDSAEAQDQQFEGFNLEGYGENGEKSWVVNGDTADILGNSIKISNVDADTFGEQKMNLKAKSGTINKGSGNIYLETDVVITSATGEQMETDTLDWKRNDDLVTTEDFVTITRENMVATGTGMTAHPNLKTAKLEKDVTVNVNPEPKNKEVEKVTITCDGPLEIDQENNIAIFNENVVAIQTGKELKADKMELYINPETNQIDRLVCIGNVEVMQGENQSFAERAVYTAANKRLVMTGRPKLILVTEKNGGMGF